MNFEALLAAEFGINQALVGGTPLCAPIFEDSRAYAVSGNERSGEATPPISAQICDEF